MDDIIKIIYGLLFLVLFLLFATTGQQYILKNQHMYNNCVSTCGEKHFMGYQLGDDNSGDFTTHDGNAFVVYNPTVNEFDRTQCIQNCNIMLLQLEK